MSGYNESELLYNLLGPGTYDNLHEPTPWSNKRPALMGLTIAFLAMSWVFVSFRLYVRFRIVKSAGLDDMFVILYLLCGSIGSAMFVISIDFGTGRHMLLLTVGEMGRYLVSFYVLNATLNMAAAFIKLSLLFQYLRVFERGSRTRLITIFMIVVVSLWGTAFTFLAWFPCTKVSDFWYSPPDAKCWGYGSSDPNAFTATFESHSALNMIFDFIILAIPMRLYFQHDMTFKMRAGLLALLLMGALVNFLGIWRLQTIIAHKAGYWPTHDPTWYGPISMLLAVLEINCASICASVPIFWPVLAPVLGYIFVTNEIVVERHEFTDLVDDKLPIQRPSSITDSENRSAPTITSERTERTERRHSRILPHLRKPSLAQSQFNADYIMGQVDPLRGSAAVQSRVRSDSIKSQNRKWTRV